MLKTISSWRLWFVRVYIKLVALGCRAYTMMRHPFLWRTPDIFLTYDTQAQREAAAKLKAQMPLVEGRSDDKLLVIVPFRDKWAMTQRCLESWIKNTDFSAPVLIALVDNGSKEEATSEGIKRFTQQNPALQMRHLRYDIPFNFSRLNNLAFAACADFAANFVLCLNNDIEIIEPDSIEKLLKVARSDPNAGAIGCTLVYPDQRIQHLFVFVGCKIVGAHPFKGVYLDKNHAWFKSAQPVGAVTGACLLVKSADFQRVGGFDEELANCYQDVDLCLKLQELGRTNWTVSEVRMIHYETQTRKPIHSWDEVTLMYQRWGQTIYRNPFINERFCTWSEPVALTPWSLGKFPWPRLRR